MLQRTFSPRDECGACMHLNPNQSSFLNGRLKEYQNKLLKKMPEEILPHLPSHDLKDFLCPLN